MALILAFDTSAAHCAVAVVDAGGVRAEACEQMAKGQAERLMPLIEETLRAANVTHDQLDAIAVGIGPGNFTGIRLSVAAARGLSLSLAVPAIGVSSLEAMAVGGPRPMLACVDARRGAVYAQEFHATSETSPALIEDIGQLSPHLPRIGSGADARPAPMQTAVAIATLAMSRLDRPAQRPAPLYIRPADAAPPRDSAPTLLP